MATDQRKSSSLLITKLRNSASVLLLASQVVTNYFHYFKNVSYHILNKIITIQLFFKCLNKSQEHYYKSK